MVHLRASGIVAYRILRLRLLPGRNRNSCHSLLHVGHYPIYRSKFARCQLTKFRKNHLPKNLTIPKTQGDKKQTLWGEEFRRQEQPTGRAREDLRRNACSEDLRRFQRSLPVGQSAICKEGGTFPSSLEVAGVAEYASKVFIRKSRTSISLGKSSPSSQIL